MSVSFQKLQTTDYTLTQIQNNIANAITQLQNQGNSTIGNGVFVTAEFLSGDNTIQHSLQRVPQGFIITAISGPAFIFNEAFTSSTTVTLNASNGVTATIFLF